MVRLRLRLVAYVGSLLALMILYTAAYRWGMANLEGEARTWIHALEVVVHSMTTTGYGHDAPWESRFVTVLMMLAQGTGIAYIFIAFPLFVIPWLQRIVEPSPPTSVEELEGHVVIVGYTTLCEEIVDELETTGTPYLVIEEDEEVAIDHHANGLSVLYGDPTAEATLSEARVCDAAAVVVDATETPYIETVLAIRDRSKDVAILALIDDLDQSRYLRYAGASEVLSPKHRLGKALSDSIRDVVVTGGDGWRGREIGLGDENEVSLGDDVEVYEFQVEAGSEFDGSNLLACQRVEGMGATLLGLWHGGDFVTTLAPDVRVDESTKILVAGADVDRDAIQGVTGSRGRPYRLPDSPVIVVGAGVIGQAAAGGVERASIETVVVDREAADAVDVVGDATAEPTLRDAGVDAADAIVLAPEDDHVALLSTLVVRELAPEVEILVAANRRRSVDRLRSAGADYVLALPIVAGRMVTQHVFGRDVMPLGERIHLIRIHPGALAVGSTNLDVIRERTGCSIVAVERNGVMSEVNEQTSIDDADRLVLAGTGEEIEAFGEAFLADAEASESKRTSDGNG